MYRWVWDHLPGPTAVRLTLASVLTAAVVALLVFVAVPTLRQTTVAPTSDGSSSDQDQVIEPDGVRASPTVPTTDSTPTPSVPEDNVPQQ